MAQPELLLAHVNYVTTKNATREQIDQAIEGWKAAISSGTVFENLDLASIASSATCNHTDSAQDERAVLSSERAPPATSRLRRPAETQTEVFVRDRSCQTPMDIPKAIMYNSGTYKDGNGRAVLPAQPSPILVGATPPSLAAGRSPRIKRARVTNPDYLSDDGYTKRRTSSARARTSGAGVSYSAAAAFGHSDADADDAALQDIDPMNDDIAQQQAPLDKLAVLLAAATHNHADSVPMSSSPVVRTLKPTIVIAAEARASTGPSAGPAPGLLDGPHEEVGSPPPGINMDSDGEGDAEWNPSMSWVPMKLFYHRDTTLTCMLRQPGTPPLFRDMEVELLGRVYTTLTGAAEALLAGLNLRYRKNGWGSWLYFSDRKQELVLLDEHPYFAQRQKNPTIGRKIVHKPRLVVVTPRASREQRRRDSEDGAAEEDVPVRASATLNYRERESSEERLKKRRISEPDSDYDGNSAEQAGLKYY
eukprot:TRINITY_DN3929_c0_g1_i1.p1 TRINITY_DN3929_c0_g1~~TRINITY_DN3929_c0_g1_i1.p1  ORF type:complete len:553 (-),score=94.22 TRINITY_DN3929_c0_g1_i1:100-1527(-)